MLGWIVVAAGVIVGGVVVRRLRKGETSGVYTEHDERAIERTRVILDAKHRRRL